MIERPRVAFVLLSRLEENIQLLRAIAEYNRYHTNWHVFIDDQALAAKDPDWLLGQGWDGMICKQSSPALIEKAIRSGIACVDLADDAHAHPECLKIRPDNRAIGHVGAEHFLEKGYRQFAFCGFESDVWSVDRREGFIEALSLTDQECRVFETVYPGELQPGWEFSEEDKVGDWLMTLPKPVAIMACNDMRALQVVNACHSVGLSVPDDVAVLGANNEVSRCDLSNPSLSSIPVNTVEYGKVAAENLERKMQEGKYCVDAKELLVDPLEVVTRRSTEALAVEDRCVASALNLIREKACSGITVEEVAKHASVSRSLLEKRFRRYVGRSPQVEIRQAQVYRIKQLLTDTDYSLAQIAEMTGFEHPEYMSVVFKRLTEITPSKFRQKNRGLAG
ncbi:MAG: XylR family transcriptional regulator [Verrucomicrobiota bacterium]